VTPGFDHEIERERSLRPQLIRVDGWSSLDDMIVDAVFWVRGRVGGSEETLEICSFSQNSGTDPSGADSTMGRSHDDRLKAFR